MKHPVRTVLIILALLALIYPVACVARLFMPTGGLAYKYRAFSTYEELAGYYSDPVFEAFAASDEAQPHKVEFATMDLQDTWGKDVLTMAYIVLDSPEGITREYTSEEISLGDIGSDIAMAPARVYCYPGNNDWSKSDDVEFRDAEGFDIRLDFEVDGVEVQKFFDRDIEICILEQQVARHDAHEQSYREDLEEIKASDNYDWWERVGIDGTWYYVRSNDEATADAVATALAHIAAGM